MIQNQKRGIAPMTTEMWGRHRYRNKKLGRPKFNVFNGRTLYSIFTL